MAAVDGITLRTSRFVAMLEFYRDRVGLALSEEGAPERRAVADLGGAAFVLVDDAASESAALSLSLRLSGGSPGTETLRDPDGNELVLRRQRVTEDLDVAGLEAVVRAAVPAMTPPPEVDADLEAWLERPESGWSQVVSPQALAAATFLAGGADCERLRIRYFRREQDGAMMAKAWFGPGTQGPPGHAHGGSMASLLDEAMGGAAWGAGHPVLAGELTTRFRRMLPLGTRCVVEARVTAVEGRKVTTVAVLQGQEGQTYAEGRGLFIELDRKRYGPLLKNIGEFFGQSFAE